MADITVPSVAGGAFPEKLVDQGDGTWARKVVASGGSSGGSVVDNVASGNLTALNQAATLTSLNGQSNISLQIVALPAGAAIQVEYSKDNFATYKTASYLSGGILQNTSPAAAGFYRYIGIAGYPQARVRVSAYTSGTVQVVLTTGTGVDTVAAITTASNPATILSAQQTLTTAAAALPTQALVNGIIVTALPTNTGTVYIGPSGVSAATGYPLAAGQSISYAVTNQSAIYIIGTNTTDKVAFTGN